MYIQIHHGREQIKLRPDSVGDKVGIDQDPVRRAEGSVGSEEHVRGGLDMAGDFIWFLLFWFFGRRLESFVAGFDRALHLRGSVMRLGKTG